MPADYLVEPDVLRFDFPPVIDGRIFLPGIGKKLLRYRHKQPGAELRSHGGRMF